jgi:hypothetical protein
MSVISQAIRARRKAKLDARYRYKNRDAAAAARKLKQTIANERRIYGR